jgi:hypothetical protein
MTLKCGTMASRNTAKAMAAIEAVMTNVSALLHRTPKIWMPIKM